MAVDMVEGAECKRERGHRSFAGDETFPFFWKVKVILIDSQSYVKFVSVLDKACVGESTRQ